MMTAFALWFGCMLVLFLCAVHWLVLKANMQQPPRLAHTPLLILLGSFLLLMVGWTVLFLRRFRLPAN